MKISTRGQYSLEALLCLATSPTDKPVSIHAISELTRLSDGYLEQLFIPLKKAGFVAGSRGVQGGYKLGKPSEKISVGEVLEAMETSLRPVPCMNGGKCERSAACSTKKVWQGLDKAMQETVRTVTLKDLVAVFHGIRGDVQG